jgi:uncharacterized protein (TIGR02231 family)
MFGADKIRTMKKILRTTLLIALILPQFVFAATSTDTKTTVTRATVFTQGAQLARVQKVNLQKGENTLRFVYLERDINPNSIQLFGVNGNENISVIYTRFFQEAMPQPRRMKLMQEKQDSIAIYQREISVRQSEVNNLETEKRLIEAHNAVGKESEETMVERLSSLAKYYRLSLNEIDQLMYDLTEELEKYTQLKQGAEQRYHAVAAQKNMGVIEAKIYATKEVLIPVELNYLVNQVNWVPFYEIKSAGLTSPLKVVCKATVNLNTGVDWDKVDLTLSTRKPEILCKVPEVHPWVLHFQEEHRKTAAQGHFINNQAISNSHLPLNQPMNTYEPAVSAASTSSYLSQFQSTSHKMINKEYNDGLKYTIQGEEGIAVMVLDEFEMEAEYMYYAVPKYDENVYLVAEIEDWEKHDLIPAYANIFLEGSYAGKLFIDPTSLDEKLNLMLGEDPDILVERKKVDQFSDKQLNLLGSTKTTEIEIQINVKSKRKNDIKLVLKDQVPVTKNEEIEVNIKDISKADKDEQTGTLTWSYTLEAMGSMQHTIKYEVKSPKNKKLYNF